MWIVVALIAAGLLITMRVFEHLRDHRKVVTKKPPDDPKAPVKKLEKTSDEAPRWPLILNIALAVAGVALLPWFNFGANLQGVLIGIIGVLLLMSIHAYPKRLGSWLRNTMVVLAIVFIGYCLFTSLKSPGVSASKSTKSGNVVNQGRSRIGRAWDYFTKPMFTDEDRRIWREQQKNAGPKMITVPPGTSPVKKPSSPKPMTSTQRLATTSATRNVVAKYPTSKLWDPKDLGFAVIATLEPGRWRWTASGRRELCYFRLDIQQSDYFPATPDGLSNGWNPAEPVWKVGWPMTNARPGAFVMKLEPGTKLLAGSQGEFTVSTRTVIWATENVDQNNPAALINNRGEYTVNFQRVGDTVASR